MLFRNFTPFPALQFESRDEKKQDFGIVVLRGSFNIIDGQPLFLERKQEPLVMADEYYDEPGESSIRMENNIAPFKPKTDIHINAVAHAPKGKALLQWDISVSLGKISKQLMVTGPRYWKHNLITGTHLTNPLPCTEVPIRYEYAFGGSYQEKETVYACEKNNVGMGFVNKKSLDKTKPIPVPQIMSKQDPVEDLGKEYPPEGLGPIAPAWQPRLAFAGTFDTVWEKTRWPDLPENFKFDFYNSAHPDLIYPGFVKGDEAVQLINLSPTPELNFTLPGYTLGLLMRCEDGQMVPLPVVLDTIHIEAPEMKAYLTWRGIFPLGNPIRALEVRMQTPEAAS